MQKQAPSKDSHSNLLEADKQIVSSNTSTKFEVADLTCIRDNRCLFSGLSFILSPGQLIQVDGPNGSGKTSLLRLACGLSTPESGAIKWNGEEIQEIRSSYMANIAYLGHVHGVKSELTALENLQIDWVLKQNPLQLAPMDALERVGLAGFEDVPCRMLSAGQKRRVALSRLLISATILWILDEPLTSIDQSGQMLIESLLTDHLSRGGMVLLTSHQKIEISGYQTQSIQLG